MQLSTGVLAGEGLRQQHDTRTTIRLTASTAHRATPGTRTMTDQAPRHIHSIHRSDDFHLRSPDQRRSTNRAGIPMPPARPSASSRPEIREVERLRIRLIDHRIELRHAT